MKNILALLGLVLALSGLGLAIAGDNLREQQTPTVKSVTEQALDKGRELWDGKRRAPRDRLAQLQMALGALGALFGLAGLLKKEHPLMSLVAMAAGGSAAAWNWLANLIFCPATQVASTHHESNTLYNLRRDRRWRLSQPQPTRAGNAERHRSSSH